jgi:hypothetical protein
MDESFLEKTWGENPIPPPARIRACLPRWMTPASARFSSICGRMVNEPGWQEPQVISARAALNAIDLPQAAANE